MAEEAGTGTETIEQRGETGGAAADAGNGAGEARTFTTEDVERIVKDRLARAKTTPPDDYEDLKAKAAQLDEIEEKNKSEIEKANDRAVKAEERASNAEASAKEIRLRAAIVAEAAKPGRNVADIDDVIALLPRDTLELDGDGNPTNIAKAMDSLLDAKPHLVAQSNGGSRAGSADQGARSGGVAQISRAQLQDMSPEAIRTALKEGKLDTALRGGG